MKKVSALWIGNSISDLEKVCIKSFLDHGYDYHLYCYNKDIDNLPEGVTLRNGNKILNKDKIFRYKSGFNAGSFSGFSNLFRYKLLYEKGGTWVDTDLCLLEDNLNFKKGNVFVTEVGEPPDGKFASSLMRAKKGCPVFKFCLKKFSEVDTDFIVHGETGPELVTKAVKKLDLKTNPNVELKSGDNYYPIHWEKSERLFYDEIDINDGWITLHFWNAWVTSELGLDKNSQYPKWSVFERLKERYLDG